MSIIDKPKILLIDDDMWQSDIYVNVLKNNYEIKSTQNLNNAIKLIESWSPQLIIADVLLSGETIFTLLNELQSDAYLGKIPVVIITNIADRLSGVDLRAYGINNLLDKSKITPQDILAAARRIL
ncbi:response regulator [Candidatus Saccharibacteria bacterium]|nr:response regulator [Candidatus Saccharibacteria bacterium]